ncbi:glycosyltransferase [Leptobacterium flavescens]|uniref:Glycosyltransferase n=1 Tax=Leptobacterium flavescens TaxID=472055 RepID=A0A6P0UG02_9FLAO|nr:glycosyltransferase [Leptobacterium flavescens]NER12165.1 glycosyltransferase [Leptobacterium flavescens]
MKVIQIIDSLEAGGAERMALNTANLLAENGIDSYLCATRKEGSLKNLISDKTAYLFLDKKRTLDLSAIFRLKHYIKSNNIGIIHAHSSSFFIAGMVKMIYPKVRVVWHNHYGNSEHLSGGKYRLLKYISSKFNAIIAVNRKLATWAEKKLKHKYVVYLPNFVKTSPEREITFLKGTEGKRIVCLANLRREKDHITLLKAFKAFHKDFPLWTLHLIGKDFGDRYSEEIRHYVKQNKLNEDVFFYGSVNDVSHTLSQCEIGVLSSNFEGLPLALLEYGLNKLAVIVTDVGECKAVIKDEKNGFVIDPGNDNELRVKLEELAGNPLLISKKADNFNNHILNKYGKEQFFNKLTQVYESL